MWWSHDGLDEDGVQRRHRRRRHPHPKVGGLNSFFFSAAVALSIGAKCICCCCCYWLRNKESPRRHSMHFSWLNAVVGVAMRERGWRFAGKDFRELFSWSFVVFYILAKSLLLRNMEPFFQTRLGIKIKKYLTDHGLEWKRKRKITQSQQIRILSPLCKQCES